MGNYTDAQRAKMPASAFCGADRSFPVLDAADARKALQALGRAAAPDRDAIRACVLHRAERHGWTVTADMAAFAAQLDAAPMGEGEATVLRTGPIFECGTYPDKDFTLTEAEADAAIAAFTPQDADYEHVPGPFDGQLGQLLTVWRDGPTLHGTAAVPRWADALLTQAGHKLSLAWDRTTKQIVGWAWVTEPRVSHAALAAAFAAQANPKETNRMSWMEELRALFARPDAPVQLSDPPPAPEETPPAPAPVVPVLVADFSAREAEIATRERQLATERAEFAKQQYWQQATTAVDRLITEGRVLPAENQPDAAGHPALVALFAQALADDATGTALFGQAGGSRFAALSAVYSARPAAPPTHERLAVTVLGADPAEKPPVDLDARRRELLAASPLGQAALKLQQKES